MMHIEYGDGKKFIRFQATALEVADGDIVFLDGYRCVASDVVRTDPDIGAFAHVVNQYTLRSAPAGHFHPHKLPEGLEGMRVGSNYRSSVMIEREVDEFPPLGVPSLPPPPKK